MFRVCRKGCWGCWGWNVILRSIVLRLVAGLVYPFFIFSHTSQPPIIKPSFRARSSQFLFELNIKHSTSTSTQKWIRESSEESYICIIFCCFKRQIKYLSLSVSFLLYCLLEEPSFDGAETPIFISYGFVLCWWKERNFWGDPFLKIWAKKESNLFVRCLYDSINPRNWKCYLHSFSFFNESFVFNFFFLAFVFLSPPSADKRREK